MARRCRRRAPVTAAASIPRARRALRSPAARRTSDRRCSGQNRASFAEPRGSSHDGPPRGSSRRHAHHSNVRCRQRAPLALRTRRASVMHVRRFRHTQHAAIRPHCRTATRRERARRKIASDATCGEKASGFGCDGRGRHPVGNSPAPSSTETLERQPGQALYGLHATKVYSGSHIFSAPILGRGLKI